MVTIGTILSQTPNSIAKRAKKVHIVSFKAFPAYDQKAKTKKRHARCVVHAIDTSTNGSGRTHTIEMRIYRPYGLKSPVWVSCSCESQYFTYEVALSMVGSSSVKYSNGEFPIEKNPRLRKGACKHTVAALWSALRRKKVQEYVQG